MRHYDLDALWRSIFKHVTLAEGEKVGRCLSFAEEQALLDACRKSRSRSILVAVTLALQGCLRLDEIRNLRWVNVDLRRKTVTVAKSKTKNGEGRVVPMSESLHSVLDLWASNFPKRRPGDYLIPSERYGQPKRGETAKVYATDPTHPLKCYKYAWAEVRERAGISARFHDLRHTGCTALLESGVSFPICAEVMGWSASTAILLAKTVYGNIGIVARQQAIAQRDQYQREQALLEARQISRQVEIPATPTIQ